MGKTEIFELPRHNAPTVPYTGKLALCSAHVEDVSNPRKGPNSSTRRTMKPYQFPVTSSKKTESIVLNMELPKGNECTLKQRRCCRKLANPSMVPKIFVWNWMDWRAHYPIRQTCTWRPLLRKELARKMNMWKKLRREIHRFILHKEQDEEINNSTDLKNMIIKLILKQDGGLALRSHRETCGIQHLRLRQLSGNSTPIGAKGGIVGDPHPGLNSSVFFEFRDALFACQKFEFPGNRQGECRQIHLPHASFSHI